MIRSQWSALALGAALWFGFVFRKNTGPKMLLTFTLGLVGATALVFFSDEIFSALSRSGHADEITSLIAQRLWTIAVLDEGLEQLVGIARLEPKMDIGDLRDQHRPEQGGRGDLQDRHTDRHPLVPQDPLPARPRRMRDGPR